MADVQPFAGLRYNLALLGGAQAMVQLIAPPYDVIDREKRAALVSASPYNVVRLELPEGEDKYQGAAQLLNEWLAANVLIQDAHPAFYVYDEELAGPDGEKVTNRVIFAAVRAYDWADEWVMPHENTMTGPKADRLALLQATRVNMSPVFSVYDDADGKISQAVYAAIKLQGGEEIVDGKDIDQPGFSFVDEDGNQCRLTLLDEPNTVAEISKAFSDKKLYIADGHHRYETSLNYRNEQRSKNIGDRDAEYIMMALSAVDDPGLHILPTHRVITEILPEIRANLETNLARYFAIEHFPQGDNPAGTVARLLKEHRGEGHIFGAYGLEVGTVSLLRLKDAGVMVGAGGNSDAWRELDVVILQKLALQESLGMTDATLAAGQGIIYVKDPAEAVAMIEDGAAQLAFFLLPTPVTAVLAVADAHDRMPRKSTYFIPKLPTGVVMRYLGKYLINL